MINSRWEPRGPALRSAQLLRVGADPAATGHTVSRPEASDACAHRRHDACGIRARHKRRLRPHLVFARHHQAVHETHRRSMYIDQNMTCGSLRVLDLPELQGVDPAERFADNGAHDQAFSLTRTATAT